MATIQYGGGVTAISGSIAGNTFSNNSSGSIVRARSIPVQPLTGIQLLSTNRLNALQTLWRSLSFAEQTTWNDFSLLHTRINPLGKTRKLHGQQWFCTINTNRQTCGLSILREAPSYDMPATMGVVYSIPTHNQILFDGNPSEVPAGENWIVYTAAPGMSCNSSFKTKLRYTAILPELSEISGIDYTAAYELIHKVVYPPASPFKLAIGVLIYPIKLSSGLANYGAYACSFGESLAS
jgi:hypothetical protein